MQEAQESTSEAKSQSHGTLGLEGEAGIIQLQLLQTGTQILKVLCLYGIHSGKDHGLHFLKSCDSLMTGVGHGGDGIAHLDLGGSLDATHDVSHVAAMEYLLGHHIHLQHTYLIGLILTPSIDKLHIVAAMDTSVYNLEICNDTSEGIEYRVKDECLQGSLFVALRRWYTVHHSIQYLLHAHSCLSTGTDDFLALASQQVHYLVHNLFRHGVWHITFVYHRDDFQVIIDGHIEVADGLCLYTLSGIHHQQGTLTCGNASAHLITEIHMSRSVDEIESITAVISHIFHLYSMTFDGDSSLTFKIHIVQHLPLGHLDGMGILQQTVGKGTFSVVNMCYDTEVSYVLHS